MRGGDGIHHPIPNARFSPAHEAIVASCARAIAFRQVAPGAPPAVDPAAAFNQYGFGYVNAQLLPAAAGGIGGVKVTPVFIDERGDICAVGWLIERATGSRGGDVLR